MTGHSLNPGSHHTFPVFNGYAPAQGPKALPVTLDFTVDTTIVIDFTAAEESNGISFVQSVWVDNSANPNALNLFFDVTQQNIVVPAFAQSVFPIIATLKSKCTASTLAVVPTLLRAIFVNVPMASEMWGPATVNIASVNLNPIQGVFIDRSGVIAAIGVSQAIMAINAGRKRFFIQNPSSAIESLFFNFTGAAVVGGPGSLELLPGGSYDSSMGPVSTEAIAVAAATAGHVFIAKEM